MRFSEGSPIRFPAVFFRRISGRVTGSIFERISGKVTGGRFGRKEERDEQTGGYKKKNRL